MSGFLQGAVSKAAALIHVKTDTSDAKRKLKDYRGAERKAHKERLDDVEKENKRLDEQIARWGKVAVGITAAAGAWKIAEAGLASYIENSNLAASTQGVNMDVMRKATRGLIEDTDLMRQSAKLMHGAWSLNEKEMEVVFRGASALQKKFGGELLPIVERLATGIQKGLTEELKDFGIQAKDKEGTLRDLNKQYEEMGGNISMLGDEMKASGVSFRNSMDTMATSLGKIVNALNPAIEKMARFVELIANAGGVDFTEMEKEALELSKLEAFLAGDKKGFFESGGTMMEFGRLAKQAREDIELDAEFYRTVLQTKVADKAIEDAAVRHATRMSDILAKHLAELVPAGTSSATKKGKGKGGPIQVVDFTGDSIGGGAGFTGSLGAGGGSGIDAAFSSGMVDSAQVDIKQQQQALALFNETYTQLALKQAEAEQRKRILESVFGTPTEISLTVAAITAAQKAFESLTASLASGYDAWVTGSESVTQAFKNMLAQQIHMLGRYMFVESVKHAGLAITDWSGRHALAAGALFAGAMAAGAVAREMGVGGSTGSRPSVGGGTPPALSGVGGRGGSGSGSQQQSVVIALGSDFGMLSDLEQRAMLSKAVQMGLRDQGGSRHVRRS